MFLSPVDGHLRRRTTGSSHHVLARDSAWSKLSARRRGNPLHGPQSGEGEGSADKRQFGSSPPGNGNKDHRPSPPCRGFQCPGPVSQSPTPATPLPSPTETPPPSTPVPPVPAPSNPAPASSSNASPAPPVNAPTSIATQTTAEAPANSATSSTPSTGTGGTSALDSQSSAIPGVANSVSSQNSASIGADGLPASTQVDGTTHPFTTESGIPYIYTTNSAGVTVTVPYGVDPSHTALTGNSGSGINTQNTPVSANGAASKGTDAGAIAGGIIGAIAFILVGVLVLWMIRRRQRNRIAPSAEFITAPRRPFAGSSQFQFQRIGSSYDSANDTPQMTQPSSPARMDTPRSFLHIQNEKSGIIP